MLAMAGIFYACDLPLRLFITNCNDLHKPEYIFQSKTVFTDKPI